MTTVSGWAERRRGTRHERGYGNAWDRLRLQVLKRDLYLCQCDECAKTDRVRTASEVDHILPKVNGGTDEMSNLQAIHPECHKAKTIKDEGHTIRVQIGIDGYPVG